MHNFLHMLAHWFGWNKGKIVSKVVGNDIWIGFQCETCGKVSGAHTSRTIGHQQGSDT